MNSHIENIVISYSYLYFWSPNSWSEQLNIIIIWNILQDQILYFFWKVLIFFETIRKSLDLKILDHSKVVILYLQKKYSKKIPKNIKFGLQVYFHMIIMLSSSDQLFELWKRRYESNARNNPHIAKYHNLAHKNKYFFVNFFYFFKDGFKKPDHNIFFILNLTKQYTLCHNFKFIFKCFVMTVDGF